MKVEEWSVREVEVAYGARFPVRDDELIIGSRPGYNGRVVVTIADRRRAAAASAETAEARVTGEGASA